MPGIPGFNPGLAVEYVENYESPKTEDMEGEDVCRFVVALIRQISPQTR